MSERKKLPPERTGTTFEIRIPRPGHRNGDLEMWVTINFFPDTGRPGEIFIKSDRSGSMASGALDAVAMSLSIAWQYGVPFEQSIGKFVNMRFEPEGVTGDPEFPFVTSPLDYIARLALARFGRKDDVEAAENASPKAEILGQEVARNASPTAEMFGPGPPQKILAPQEVLALLKETSNPPQPIPEKRAVVDAGEACDNCTHVRGEHLTGAVCKCTISGCSCSNFIPAKFQRTG
jgi:ribonucleoside-diphosphate reductase alpha chain